MTFIDPEIIAGSTSVDIQFVDASYPTTQHSYSMAYLYLKNTAVALQTIKSYDNTVSVETKRKSSKSENEFRLAYWKKRRAGCSSF